MSRGFTAALVGIAVIGVLFLLLTFHEGSNCGGNSAALAECSEYVCGSLATIIEMHSPIVTNATYGEVYGHFDRSKEYLYAPELLTQENLYCVPRSSGWTGRAPYLIRTNAVTTFGRSARKVIIVCSRAFNNVPRRRFLKSPFRHAVGYCDGSTGLISRKEFEALDLENFFDTERYLERRKAQPAGGGSSSATPQQ